MEENYYARPKTIEGWNQSALSDGRVLVVGAGTTGNEVVKNLALLGVGTITIVDNDCVEEVNLSRCVLLRYSDIGKPKAEAVAERARELNPYITVQARNTNVIHGLGCLEYTTFDCVVLAVDNLEARRWVNQYCYQARRPLIDTGVGGWIGNVFVTAPQAGVCLECRWTPRQYDALQQRYSCSEIGLAFDEPKIPMMVAPASIVGGVAAQEVIKILHGRQSSLAAKMYWADGESATFMVWEQSSRSDCAHHEYPFLDTCEALCQVSIEESVEHVQRRLADQLCSPEVQLVHDKTIIYSVSCRQCEYSYALTKPVLLDQYRRQVCPRCGFLEVVADMSGLSPGELRGSFSLAELGVPPRHLLRVYYEQEGTVRVTWIATC